MLISLRSALYFVSMSLSTLLYGLAISTVGLLLPLAVRDRMAASWGHANLWLMRNICGLKYHVTGQEHLPTEACIVMSKHQSAWETIAFKALLHPQQSWILKRELMWIPVFGWALAAIPNIPINRKAGRAALKQITQKGTELLNLGRIIIIFPEGTRTAPGEKRKYGIGGGMLAEKSGFPVVPIAHNAGVFWKRRGFKKFPGTIEVVVGPPLDSQGMKASEITRAVEQWIEEQMKKLPVNP